METTIIATTVATSAPPPRTLRGSSRALPEAEASGGQGEPSGHSTAGLGPAREVAALLGQGAKPQAPQRSALSGREDLELTDSDRTCGASDVSKLTKSAAAKGEEPDAPAKAFKRSIECQQLRAKSHLQASKWPPAASAPAKALPGRHQGSLTSHAEVRDHLSRHRAKNVSSRVRLCSIQAASSTSQPHRDAHQDPHALRSTTARL